MKYIYNLIKKSDILSMKVFLTLSHEGDIRSKTFLGGVLTLIAIILTAIFFTIFLIDFFKNKQKSFIFRNINQEDLILKDTDKYPILIRLTDKMDNPFINQEQIYQVYE